MGEDIKVSVEPAQPTSKPRAKNTSGTLALSGQSVEQTPLPATFVPISTKDGKPVFVDVPGGNGTVKKACLAGYDTATGKAYCICSDTPQNRNAFVSSKQPKIDRASEPTTDAIVQYHRDAHDVLSITIKSDKLKTKVENGKLVLTQAEANDLVKKSSRTLMHVVDKKKENEQAQAVAEQAAKQKESWWDKHKWKVIIGVLVALALTTIGILGFRKGGWWNKRKKGGNSSPTTVAPGPTTPTPFIPHDTEPGPTTTPPLNSQVPTVNTTQSPLVGENITGGDNSSSGNNSANATKPPLVNG